MSLCRTLAGPVVPKVILMNWQTNQKVAILNNYTALETKYAAMAKPNIQIIQVNRGLSRRTRSGGGIGNDRSFENFLLLLHRTVIDTADKTSFLKL